MSSTESPSFHASTANALDGYRVQRTFGVVRGIRVRSRGVVGMFGARLQTIFGGDITLLADMCERARADAFDAAVRHAELLGANALVAIRYDTAEVMPGVTEVLCYGTAVRVIALLPGDATP
jgi:uncharacterized protein YbjQ (UPF0145 family)